MNIKKLMNKKNKKSKKGFTLIELIIVIAIIGVLTLLAAPRYLRYINDAHVTAMKADAKVLSEQAVVAITRAETKTSDESKVLEEAGIFKGSATGIDKKDEAAVKAAGLEVPANEETVGFDAAKLKEVGVKLKNNAEDYRYMVKSGEVYTVKPQKDAEGKFFISNKQKKGIDSKPDMSAASTASTASTTEKHD